MNENTIVYDTNGDEVDLNACYYWNGGWYERDGMKYAYLEEQSSGITYAVVMTQLPETVIVEIMS